MRWLSAGALSLIVRLAFVSIAGAAFGDTANVGANTFATDTLNAPTAPGATTGTSITLNWTATADTYAAGHRVYRSTTSGGPYSPIADVSPRTVVSYIDSPAPDTYYYVLRAYVQNWESVSTAQVSAGATTNTGFLSCSANAAVTSSSGDNNGFEVNPANACADGGGHAEDNDSGTGTSTSCTSTAKDRHHYYDYNVSVPAGATINGIELRLDAYADATGNAPRFCAQLSWDGGTSWTTAKVMGVNLTTTEATYTLGGTGDNWGRTWAVGDFSNANFRVRVIPRSSLITRDFRLDWAAVRVTYTP